jgi:hypothetical protein
MTSSTVIASAGFQVPPTIVPGNSILNRSTRLAL